jgi:hypothetical protein
MFLVAFGLWSGQALFAEGDDYQEIKNAALQIADIDNPNAMVIGMGRSPAPFVAFLSQLRPGLAMNLSLSRFRYFPEIPGRKVKGSFGPLRPEEEQALFAHFDRYLPETLLQNKKIVLLDYCYRGESLLAAGEYLKRYLQSRHRNNEVSLVAITSTDKAARVQKYSEQLQTPIKIVTMRDSSFSRAMVFSDYKRKSEYPQFHIRPEREYGPEKFARFVEWLRDRGWLKTLLYDPPELPLQTRLEYHKLELWFQKQIAQDPRPTLPDPVSYPDPEPGICQKVYGWVGGILSNPKPQVPAAR